MEAQQSRVHQTTTGGSRQPKEQGLHIVWKTPKNNQFYLRILSISDTEIHILTLLDLKIPKNVAFLTEAHVVYF